MYHNAPKIQITTIITCLCVSDQIPKPTISKAPNFNPMYAGESIIITCKVDVGSDWTYQWYRDKQILSDISNVINILLKTSDKGNYSCKATRGKTTTTEVSDEMPLDVVGKRRKYLFFKATLLMFMICGFIHFLM